MSTRIARLVLALVVVELSCATAVIHLTLGGTLFALNGLGYLVLATVYGVVAVLPIETFGRFGWLARVGLAGFALTTIGAYLIAGTSFLLGWVTKGIEVGIVGLVITDLLITYGDPRERIWAAIGSRVPHAGGGSGAPA